jgi:lysophospholipase L1-like esterase
VHAEQGGGEEGGRLGRAAGGPAVGRQHLQRQVEEEHGDQGVQQKIGGVQAAGSGAQPLLDEEAGQGQRAPEKIPARSLPPAGGEGLPPGGAGAVGQHGVITHHLGIVEQEADVHRAQMRAGGQQPCQQRQDQGSALHGGILAHAGGRKIDPGRRGRAAPGWTPLPADDILSSMQGRPRKILFAILAVVLVMGTGEAALRLAGFHYQPIPERIWLGRLKGGIPSAEVVFDRLVPGLFVRDGLLFWKPAAGKEPFNAAGLRAAEELPAVRPPDEFRVLTLGDSCTFLGEPLPWPDQLARQLAAARGGRVRFLNAGVPAYTSLQGRRFLESRMEELQPDVVTIYFGWNDHWRATVKPDAEFPIQGSGVVAVQGILSRSRLYQGLNYLLKGRTAAGGEAPPVADGDDLSAQAVQRPFRVSAVEFEENLLAMVARIRAGGGRAVLITAPSTLAPDAVPNYLFAHGFVAQGGERVDLLHQRYAAVVRRVARATGALLVDAAADFAATPDGGDSLMRDDGIHLTAAGIERLAGLVARQIDALQSSSGSPVSPAASNSR